MNKLTSNAEAGFDNAGLSLTNSILFDVGPNLHIHRTWQDTYPQHTAFLFLAQPGSGSTRKPRRPLRKPLHFLGCAPTRWGMVVIALYYSDQIMIISHLFQPHHGDQMFVPDLGFILVSTI